MSTQINQYLMYGILLPYSFHKEWEKENNDDFYEKFEEFIEDSSYDSKVNHVEGIHCLFDGRDGRFIIIGRVIAKSKDGELLGCETAITIMDDKFTELEKELLSTSIKRNFGITGVLKYHFVTVYS